MPGHGENTKKSWKIFWPIGKAFGGRQPGTSWTCFVRRRLEEISKIGTFVRMFWLGLLLFSAGRSLTSFSNVTQNVLLPPVKIIFNSSDSQMRDFVHLLQGLSHVTELFETEEVPCVQLLTLPAEPWQLHVLLLRADVRLPLCEPRVYGPLPRTLQVRFALPKKGFFGSQNVVSFQLNSRGGQLLFDLDLDNESNVLGLALIDLLEIVEMTPAARNQSSPRGGGMVSRPAKKTFKVYQREGELFANPEMTKQIEEAGYRKKTAHSMPMSYLSALFSVPLLTFASAVSYLLLWDKEQPAGKMENSEENVSSNEEDSTQKETESLLRRRGTPPSQAD